jgi:hypothetical protein
MKYLRIMKGKGMRQESQKRTDYRKCMKKCPEYGRLMKYFKKQV